MLAEEGDVLPAIPEGRETEGKHGQPVIEVLPEASPSDFLVQVLIGRGDDPDVDRNRFCPADLGDLLLPEDPEQLDLGFEGQLADLVQEDRPVAGLLELARRFRPGVGEGPPDMAKELGFDEVPGNGPAIDDDERAVLAGAGVMDGPGDELLAGPALPGDEDRAVDLGDPSIIWKIALIRRRPDQDREP